MNRSPNLVASRAADGLRAGRVRGRPRTLRVREVAQKLRGHLAAHDSIGAQAGGHRPLRAEPAPLRPGPHVGVLLASGKSARLSPPHACKPESTDRSLKGRAAGLPESSAGASAFAGRCRSEEPSLSVAQRGSGALRAPARGCARRARACWREPRSRAGAVSGRQAGSGSARNRTRAAAHWPAQGQRFARCRVQRRAEWVSRPARAK